MTLFHDTAVILLGIVMILGITLIATAAIEKKSSSHDEGQCAGHLPIVEFARADGGPLQASDLYSLAHFCLHLYGVAGGPLVYAASVAAYAHTEADQQLDAALATILREAS